MIRSTTILVLIIAILSSSSRVANASIFLPGSTSSAQSLPDLGRSAARNNVDDATFHRRRSYQRALSRYGSSSNGNSKLAAHPLAMAIPGNGLAEQVVIGGFGNFISIYNTVITARILLSWFPQAQGVAILQPVFQITDPYLNLFRGLLPPIFGLDLSPILAFVTLDLLQKSAVSLAEELPGEGMMDGQMRERLVREMERNGMMKKSRWGMKKFGGGLMNKGDAVMLKDV